jgi:hypothetical protein
VLSYVVPLRRWAVDPINDLADYLGELSTMAEVIVVDGSAPEIFDTHARAFAGRSVRHLAVDPARPGRSGKVRGVLTGVDAASHEHVVIADDDVRYGPAQLRQVDALLADADLVRPQNYFDPLPWHARWDTARTLLNRALTADYPGTLGVRRSTLRGAGGYDADALFENLELIRTIEAVDGCVQHAPDVYVRRLPPSTRQFRSQRVRQAFDSWATPGRLALELALLPATVGLAALRRWVPLTAAASATMGLAEYGRRRAGGAAVFPVSSSFLAPGWLLERAVCAWIALAHLQLLGGVRYAGATFSRAATSRSELRRRLGPRRSAMSVGTVA